MIKGKVRRISGPIVYVEGLGKAGLYDMVEIGEKRLSGEIIRLDGDIAVAQVYEDNTGLELEAVVHCTGRPLSVRLGPGLIGSIYDGIQRPLEVLKKKAGSVLPAGIRGEPLDIERRWEFQPDAALREALQRDGSFPALPGSVLGVVKESALIDCKIMVPPDCKDATINYLAPSGQYTVNDCIARTSGGTEIALAQWWPVRKSRPFAEKLPPSRPLVTGQRVIDLFFPLSRGGTAAIPGGFGTGKTMTQHAVAKWCDADVIVYIGCGERGNEMTDVLQEFPALIDPRSGKSLMERTILVANTSNMPVAAREVSIYTGVTIAEFYRDMGYQVAIMADSTSRWAEALRELSGRMEEMPAEEGFPAYLPTRLAEFYERAGRVTSLNGSEGSLTIIGAVSPPGGDFSEPVTQQTKRFIRCFWALDRELANSRHYPAISWTDSYSEYAEEVASWWSRLDPDWQSIRREALDLLKREQRLAEIVRLIGPDALPDDQRLVLMSAELLKNGFLQQNSFDPVDMFCIPARQMGILKLIMSFHRLALNCIQHGAPLLKITALPIRERLVRLKSEAPNEDPSILQDAERQLKNETGELERYYRVKESV